VKCKFTLSGTVDSVFYNNVDLTNHVVPNDALSDWSRTKVVNFMGVPSSPLVISGFANASLGAPGFSIVCLGGREVFDTDIGKWTAYGSATPLASNDIHRKGMGSGWMPLENTASVCSALECEEHVKPVIWAAGGSPYVALKWTFEPKNFTCSFNIKDAVDEVWWNGENVTDQITLPEGGSMLSASAYKKITLQMVPGAALIITGHASEGSAAKFKIVCDEEAGTANHNTSWLAYGSSTSFPTPVANAKHLVWQVANYSGSLTSYSKNLSIWGVPSTIAG